MENKAPHLPWGKAMGRFMIRLRRQEKSWCTGIGELVGKTAAKLACFGQDFLSCLLVKCEYQFLMFKRTQVGDIAFIINKNHGNGRAK